VENSIQELKNPMTKKLIYSSHCRFSEYSWINKPQLIAR